MERHSEILRFQEGIRSQHPAPEVAIELLPSGSLLETGELLAILVDLDPTLPHRGREMRSVAVEAYQDSSGTIVARLRRALAEANRYLVSINARSSPDQNTSGSITCAVFCGEELFVGQAGASNACLCHADGTLEVFPQEAEPILPLGAVLPPVIHISYASVAEGDTLLMATSYVAEALSRSHWAEALSAEALDRGIDHIVKAAKENGVTGSAALVRCLPEPVVAESTSPHWHFPSIFRRREEAPMEAAAAPTLEKPGFLPEISHAEKAGLPGGEITSHSASERAETPAGQTDETIGPYESEQAEMPAVQDKPHVSERAGMLADQSIPDLEEAAEEVIEEQPAVAWSWPTWHLPDMRPLLEKMRHLNWKLPRIPVGALLKALLPGKIEGGSHRATRPIPKEQTPVIGGVAVGFLLIVGFITLTTYLQYGGALSADTTLKEAHEALIQAHASQASQDWKQVLDLSEKALVLDPSNTNAQGLRDEARMALDAIEQSALLSAMPLLELGTAPSPRRLLVAGSWVYILNPATDEVFGVPLSQDGMTPVSSVPTSILKRGQSLLGQTVDHLIDLAWVSPSMGYPDGAVFIYSDDGVIYIYEPSLGPLSIVPQRLEGDLTPGTVTLIEAFDEHLYVVDRQQNQILRYASINGSYNGPARPYFAQENVPQLQTALDVSVDERLYLLLGNGTLGAYFGGTEDLSFSVQGLPSTEFRPTVMAVEPDPETGRIYLGDPQHERIFALDKKGHFLYQYRLPNEALKHLEVLAVNETPHVLYLIAENRLYAAPIPESTP
ncbi:MAG: hypothetical protein RBT47_03510 [Anaerolineae bacterium]|jgi:hypothetical protein|nr:hypothetical protein [Anaerolineae bacterium]